MDMNTTSTQDVDTEAITAVALDYFEGWFTADAERMGRALHPQLAKRNLDAEANGLEEDSAAGMVEATAAGVGRRHGDPGEISIEVVEVYGRIATAVVHSRIYREYLHVARTREGWKIVNALWQPT